MENGSQSNDMNSLAEEARELVRDAVRDYSDKYGTGSMSCAIYDTAWIALVTKSVRGQKIWRFPEAFHFLLRNQDEDGTLAANQCVPHTDRILTTASAVLALRRHRAEPLQIKAVADSELWMRIEKATVALSNQLKAWDIYASTHVRFEIIVPALLQLLEDDGEKTFKSDGRNALMRLNELKLAHFKPEYLYGAHQSTALHSLEAFIGKIDFDRVSHHKVNGSMMASPSSTEAYLMNASTWDIESENYLVHVVTRGQGNGEDPYPVLFLRQTSNTHR